jgi:sulfatase modifying factor 1
VPRGPSTNFVLSTTLALAAFATGSIHAEPEPPEGMIWIPMAEFSMGSDHPLARMDERPVHRVREGGFFADITEVTNAQFRAFVEATGHTTVAERAPDWEELKKQLPPGTPKPPAEVFVPGSLVFYIPEPGTPLNAGTWWHWVEGADWQHPQGPGSSIEGKDDHPVVHIAWDDAVAYAEWAGKRLPTEAEWERLARGTNTTSPYTWGDRDPEPADANIWQGTFPTENTEADGYLKTAPVRAFPPNTLGLHGVAGNVWEWTADWFASDQYARRVRTNPNTKVFIEPQGPAEMEGAWDANDPISAKRTIRGGSFLCHVSYCSSYRPSARMATTPDTSAEHIGFRCVMDPPKPDSPVHEGKADGDQDE